jgi:hypothetical protein
VTRRRALGAGLLLIALAAWAGADAARRSFWTTTDEAVHVVSSRELRSGPGLVSNVEHPVFMKLVAAAALPADSLPHAVDETRAARRLFPVLFSLLVLAAGVWTSWLSGAVAGLAVAALLALDPSLRGHGALVTSDVLVTLFLVAAAAALDRSGRGPRRPGLRWLSASAVLYGLAMASKYSAMPFLLPFLLLGIPRLRTGRRSLLSVVKPAATFVLVALLTLAAVQAAAFATTSDVDFRAGLQAQFRNLPQEDAVRALADRLPKWAAAYGAGLLFVQGVAGPGERFNYFFGDVSGTGYLAYFPVALAVKLPAAMVFALVAAPALCLVALFRAGRARRRRLARLLGARSFLPVALGLAWLAAAALSNVNIGVRHVFPCVPFFLTAAAGVFATLLRPWRKAGVAAAAAVVFLAAAEAAGGHGREISFGNLLAGGNAGLPRTLSDSNVDWSQEQGHVFVRVGRGDLGRVGVVSIYVDEQAARSAGIVGQVLRPDAPVDTVFFSRHLWDLAPALERSTETWSKFVWARGWLVPLRRGLEARATSVETFDDAYVLLRLRPRAGG